MTNQPRSRFPVVDCARVPIAVCTPTEASAEVIRLALASKDRGVDVHLCNAYTLALADKSVAFLKVLQASSINCPDGKAVVWANKVRHRHLKLGSDRVYGPDLFLDVFLKGQDAGLRHYLLGSSPDVLERLRAELMHRFPSAHIQGSASPPYRPLTDDERHDQVRKIVNSKAHVIWVGLGTPKQDWESARLASETEAVFVAVGAAFDFVAGVQRQAPRWMQTSGLEWLYRLCAEPRRLWRRYLFGNVGFLAAAVRAGGRSKRR